MNSGLALRSTASGSAGPTARHPRDLSSGERERLALAAVAVAEPDVLDPRRADARRRPRAEGGARRVARGVRRVGEGGRRRDPRPRAAGAPSDRTLCFRNTSGSPGGARWRLGSPRLAAAAALGARRVGGARPCPRRGRDAARRRRRPRRRVRVARGRHRLGARPDARRDARRPRRRGTRALRPDPERPAGDGDRRRRRASRSGRVAASPSARSPRSRRTSSSARAPHTPWQMLAWGGCGLLAGLLRPVSAAPARVRGLHARASASRSGR